MAWIALTTNDVRERLSWPELDAFQNWHRAPNQVDPIPETISGVVREVRGYVGGCSRNTLGTDGTIPEELYHAALALIRWRLATRLPGCGPDLLDEARKTEYEDAKELLRAVSRCQFGIESPAGDSCDASDGSNHAGQWGGNAFIQF